MNRFLAPFEKIPHGRTHNAGEPLVFHCNFYNYWLQKTILLDESLDMEKVIQDAAALAIFPLLERANVSLGLSTAAQRQKLAEETFAALGFGLLDLSAVTMDGGEITLAISHYGRCLRQACGVDFARPQSLFDAGYAASATAFVHQLPMELFEGEILSCQSMGASVGKIQLRHRSGGLLFPVIENNMHSTREPPEPNSETNVDETKILQALAGLDFSGNEEGLIPRFGVMLTNHFANFYNRISFEFVRRMSDTGLLEAAEALLLDAGYRCAFHTFGGIMTSAEWDAVIKPQCKNKNDWIHGMIAVVNSLGWGVWRIAELTDDRIVVRIFDDYESCGWMDMYGVADRPVSFLAQGGVAGLMNLVHVGHIEDKPTLDLDFFARCFEADGLFEPEQTMSLAGGDPYTEIIATR